MLTWHPLSVLDLWTLSVHFVFPVSTVLQQFPLLCSPLCLPFPLSLTFSISFSHSPLDLSTIRLKGERLLDSSVSSPIPLLILLFHFIAFLSFARWILWIFLLLEKNGWIPLLRLAALMGLIYLLRSLNISMWFCVFVSSLIVEVTIAFRLSKFK